MPLFRKSKKQASTQDAAPLPSLYTRPFVAPNQPPAQTSPHFYQNQQYQSQQQLSWSPFQPRPPASSPQPRLQEPGPYRYGYHAVPVSSSNLLQPPPFYPSTASEQPVQQSKWASYTNLAATVPHPHVQSAVNITTDYINRGTNAYDLISKKFTDVISLIDDETFTGNDKDLVLTFQPYDPPLNHAASQPALRGGRSTRALLQSSRENSRSTGNDDCIVRQTAISQTTNVFAKTNFYINSRLPSHLPPFLVYVPTWPLLCIAAQYSMNAYTRPQGAERHAYVDGQWRMGTKTMVIKSLAMDDMHTIVFAIRGTVGIMDWAVNLRDAPASPSGFLDDPGNLCHAGFLDSARKMIKPVAARLRQLLEENPSRAACSLVITGHSAGGAVAALLYCHMLSESVRSELSILTGCFKRIHCVTFGAPPISLLPLAKPANSEKKLRKSLFLSIINEGDPVARADKAYVKSLFELYKSPLPKMAGQVTGLPKVSALASSSRLNLSLGAFGGDKKKQWNKMAAPNQLATIPENRTWEVPPATLSNAGRLVALRMADGGKSEDDVRACIVTDQQLRTVIFGDPIMHQMKVYSRRLEVLATRAVIGR